MKIYINSFKKKLQRWWILGLSGFLLFCSSSVLGQIKTNAEILNKLADSSAAGILLHLPHDTARVYVRIITPESYNIFSNRVISFMAGRRHNISVNSDSSLYMVNYALERGKVFYSVPFREELFGSYKVKREVNLLGSYFVSTRGVIGYKEDFNLAYSDTLEYEDIQLAEDGLVPATKGEIPAIPVFSNLWEPAVAIGAAAVTVYLFFTVRSR